MTSVPSDSTTALLLFRLRLLGTTCTTCRSRGWGTQERKGDGGCNEDYPTPSDHGRPFESVSSVVCLVGITHRVSPAGDYSRGRNGVKRAVMRDGAQTNRLP
jgi:hypothetical protein